MIASDTAECETVFDPRDLELLPASLPEKIAFSLLKNGRFLRFFFPIAKFPGLTVVTRFDDVQEVLRRDDVFHMGLAEKHELITDGSNFLLGMEDGAEYRRMLSKLMKAFPRSDFGYIRDFCACRSRTIVADAGGRLDAIEDLITRVPVLLCEDYYGILLNEDDRLRFSQWTFAVSQYLFGDVRDNPSWHRAAVAASERLRKIIDASISKAKAQAKAGDAIGAPVLARLIDMQLTDPHSLSDAEIRASLMGMITGFIPTNTMAASNLLEVMLRREDIQAAAQAAARADDDEKLERVLFETARFESIGVGRFRVCAEDTVLAAGTSRETNIRRGETILAGTLSAMFDRRRVKNPQKFNPDRDPNESLLFGHGLHACLGLFIARAQITQTLKPLLKKNSLRPAKGHAGRMTRFGLFPQHLIVEFEN